jgi:hypothetical protein
MLAWPWCPEKAELVVSGQAKIAFVAAAFSVTAYNLRTRVVDLIMKTSAPPDRMSELCRIVRNCGTRLTNLVLWFTVTALLMGATSMLSPTAEFSRWFAAFVFGAFLSSFVHFVYIVVSFDKVERFVMDEVERASRRAEAKRLGL